MITWITYNQLCNDVWELARSVDADAIVGIPRSGMLVANMLSLKTHLPFLDLPGFLAGALFFGPSGQRTIITGKVMVVDDSCASGETMRAAKEQIEAAGMLDRVEFAAVYTHPETRFKLDKSVRSIPSPRLWEWNLWRHDFLRRALLDFDGVLCPDPPYDDDRIDGPYHRYIESAPVLHRVRGAVKGIVTNRLEKWRSVTQEWIDRHDVKSGGLIMAQYDTAAERRANHSYGTWKGEIFKQSDAALFVESSLSQSHDIFRVALKPVLCVDTMELLQ